MPKIRYQLKLNDSSGCYTFWEEQLFAPGEARSLVTREVVQKFKHPVELLDAIVTDPFTHEHTWKAGKLNAFAGKKYYRCERCGITGWRKFIVVKGEVGGINRDEEYQTRKHELCHDPLKKLKKLTL